MKLYLKRTEGFYFLGAVLGLGLGYIGGIFYLPVAAPFISLLICILAIAFYNSQSSGGVTQKDERSSKYQSSGNLNKDIKSNTSIKMKGASKNNGA